MEWMAEVETRESLTDQQTPARWKKATTGGIPFYLLVPRGLKESTHQSAQNALVAVSGIYEYAFVNGLCHVL